MQIYFVWSLHGALNGCYYGGFEAWSVMLRYTEWINEPSIIGWTLLSNLGFIYTNLRDIWLYFVKDKRTPIRSMYALGLTFGQIIYFIFIARYYSEQFETIAPENIQYLYGSKLSINLKGHNTF